ncbi:phage major capsid protein [Aromatoleum toluolicum]|nr:phage major capsid protein [Aromatoleum toluolicum]NMF98393.2 phage major capsid protein [Aromatoleum toluolicum]
MKSTHFKFGIAATILLAMGSALAGVPVFSPDIMAGLAMLGVVGNVELIEIKKIIDQQGEAWSEFKKTNDEILKAKAEGKAVGDLETKLAKISADMEKLADLKEQFDAIEKKLGRPKTDSEVKAEADFAAELKSFNIALRADCASKGKAVPAEFDAEGYRLYKSAFFKLVAGVPVDSLESSERKALQAGSDPDGGYFLPHATMGRVVGKVYEQSVMRQLASVQTISTNDIEGIVDNDEAAAGWVSELGTRSDSATPTVGKWKIEAFEMYAMPKASQKILDDAATDVEAWLSGKIADKFARVEGTAFWTGNGAGKPMGLASYATAATADASRAWGTFEHVKTGTNGDFNATTKGDPLHDLIGAFKDQYLQNANFVMRREVRTKIRKLKEATTDRYLWEPSMQAGTPDRLNGYPVRIDQYMPALATDSLSLALGDFKEAYQIVDRMGIRTLRDPFTAKPYVVFYSTKRTGGGAVNFEAVKFLKFAA